MALSKIAHFFNALRETRRSRSLSQTRLGQLFGIPQSHLSELEQGQHDIKLSTFVEWARLLDFEVMLIPRQHGPAVSYLIKRSADHDYDQETPSFYGPLPDTVSSQEG